MQLYRRHRLHCTAIIIMSQCKNDEIFKISNLPSDNSSSPGREFKTFINAWTYYPKSKLIFTPPIPSHFEEHDNYQINPEVTVVQWLSNWFKESGFCTTCHPAYLPYISIRFLHALYFSSRGFFTCLSTSCFFTQVVAPLVRTAASS